MNESFSIILIFLAFEMLGIAKAISFTFILDEYDSSLFEEIIGTPPVDLPIKDLSSSIKKHIS